jgi:Bacteriophage Lambda NinG protein.
VIEAKTIQKYKNKKLGKLIEEAQKLVNAYVRQRDAINEQGDFICISCRKLKSKSQCNAGHYFNRGNYGSVRFDLDNIHSQCVQCNLYEHGNLIPYRENLIKKIGTERFEQLEQLARLRGFKFDRITIIETIERFKRLKNENKYWQ